MKPGLERMRALMRILRYPYQKFRAVHVAGTNGKGSVCAMIESAARVSGIRTGLYISPHLSDLSERISVDGRKISQDQLARLISKIRAKAGELEPEITYFEMVTAAAFCYFAEMGVELAIVETGMGGRLDATNILTTTEICVITSIGLDHTEHLGDTLAEIAREKAGIVKMNSICVTSSKLKPIETACRDSGAVLRRVSRSAGMPADLECALKGSFQIGNIALAWTALDSLKRRGWPVTDRRIREGLLTVQWPCRFDWREISCGGTRAPILLDGAHNSHAVRALMESILRLPVARQKCLLVFNALTDKDVRGMIKMLIRGLKVARICVPILDTSRSSRPSFVGSEIRQLDKRVPVETFSSVPELARRLMSDGLRPSEKWILATGSLYLVGKLIKPITHFAGVGQAARS